MATNTAVTDNRALLSGNGLSAPLNYEQWNHVVATFDGKYMRFWVNGKPGGDRESKEKTYDPTGNFNIGSAGEPGGERFKGMFDNVRVYNRAIPDNEAIAHFQAEKAEYLDLTWLNRIKVTPYFYPERGEVLVEAVRAVVGEDGRIHQSVEVDDLAAALEGGDAGVEAAHHRRPARSRPDV